MMEKCNQKPDADLSSSWPAQFVFSFVMGLVYLVVRVGQGRACSGEPSLAMNVAINAVFLTLFVDFHRKNYRDKGKKKKRV